MSLASTANELRQLAHDLRHYGTRVDLENRAENLFAMATEIEQQPSEDDLRLILFGGAPDQQALNEAVARAKAVLGQ